MGRWRKVKQGKIGKRREKRKTSDETALPCAPITLRLKAFLTDTFMITMPILYIVIYLVMGDREGFREHMGEGWLIILIVHMAATLLFWKLKAQTPGMKAYDLTLIDPQTGEKPGIVKLFLRYVMLQTAILSFFGMFLPFIMRHKEGLHDLVSGTCIVYRPR
ncbi:RDD family protein [Hydrogenimonas cancrithermarum]|uniref:RDD family protein n=1 Tax=Hydrogenimonas cancrithermarum TaxID=2993563 RepID=A0ABN6WW40_9BACT|nr:RDD family protein [Hydrogenimonas cancrithermarum]BDY13096.1 RDD family protein [Hydrogenimonas cancrithermarum]